MANSINEAQEVDDLYEKLTLEEEEEAGLVFEKVQLEDDKSKYKWCLVGVRTFRNR